MSVVHFNPFRDNDGFRTDLMQYYNAQILALTTSSARIAVATDAPIMCLYAAADCFIKFGGNTVVAATTTTNFDVFLAAGTYFIHPVLTGKNYVAGIVASSTGTLYVMNVKGS